MRFKRALLPDYVAAVLLIAALGTLLTAGIIGERQRREIGQPRAAAGASAAGARPAERTEPWAEFYRRLLDLVDDRLGAGSRPTLEQLVPRPPIPYLSEPWYC